MNFFRDTDATNYPEHFSVRKRCEMKVRLIESRLPAPVPGKNENRASPHFGQNRYAG